MKMSVSYRDKILQLLGAEGEVDSLYAEAGAEPGDDVFIAEIEYDLWD